MSVVGPSGSSKNPLIFKIIAIPTTLDTMLEILLLLQKLLTTVQKTARQD